MTRAKAEATAAAASAGSVEPPHGARAGMQSLRQACRQIFGIPDYERYLAHHAEHHAGETPLSREAFFARAIDRKYGKSGPRCC